MELNKPDRILRYKADASRYGLMIIAALAPIWAFWIPIVLILPALAAFRVDLTAATATLLLLIAFLSMTMVCAVAGIIVCLDNQLIIGEKGIKIPSRFLLNTRGRYRFQWNELKKLVFEKDGSPSGDPESLVLHFDKSKRVKLHIAALLRQDIPNILMAIQAYSPQTIVEPEQANLAIATAVSTPASFTRIWEEELNSRFGSTIFVPLEPGQELQSGRLKIVGQIAFGGLSAIYLAKLNEEKLVVIKEAVVPQNVNKQTQDKALEMFSREASLLINLNHPQIARVFDHFIENGRNYLLLEYIVGTDLRTYVKENGPIQEIMVARWTTDVAAILSYLHHLQPPIVHRDLTPDNLVLGNDGSIYLIDFGAANTFMGTATGTLVGKQSYISPEQFRGKAEPASDFYSLGATLHYLLTGQDPEPLAVSHPNQLKPTISANMNNLVAALTKQDCAERLAQAQEVTKAAQAIIDSNTKAVGHHA